MSITVQKLVKRFCQEKNGVKNSKNDWSKNVAKWQQTVMIVVTKLTLAFISVFIMD
jgi:hypothetical protein